MKITAAAILMLSAFCRAEEGKLDVSQYEGPKECSDEEKVKAGDYLQMHYHGTIDKSSETGEKGALFDSSRERDSTFDFQIGVGMVIPGMFSILRVSVFGDLWFWCDAQITREINVKQTFIPVCLAPS